MKSWPKVALPASADLWHWLSLLAGRTPAPPRPVRLACWAQQVAAAPQDGPGVGLAGGGDERRGRSPHSQGPRPGWEPQDGGAHWPQVCLAPGPCDSRQPAAGRPNFRHCDSSSSIFRRVLAGVPDLALAKGRLFGPPPEASSLPVPSWPGLPGPGLGRTPTHHTGASRPWPHGQARVSRPLQAPGLRAVVTSTQARGICAAPPPHPCRPHPGHRGLPQQHTAGRDPAVPS